MDLVTGLCIMLVAAVFCLTALAIDGFVQRGQNRELYRRLLELEAQRDVAEARADAFAAVLDKRLCQRDEG